MQQIHPRPSTAKQILVWAKRVGTLEPDRHWWAGRPCQLSTVGVLCRGLEYEKTLLGIGVSWKDQNHGNQQPWQCGA